jgi:hypothetical protein
LPQRSMRSIAASLSARLNTQSAQAFKKRRADICSSLESQKCPPAEICLTIFLRRSTARCEERGSQLNRITSTATSLATEMSRLRGSSVMGFGRIFPIALALIALWRISLEVSRAADLRANELSSLCSKRRDTPESAICSTYLKGVADGVITAQIVATAMQQSGVPLAKEVCAHYMISADEARAIVETFMRDHPDEQNQLAAAVAGRAIWEATSCHR